MPPVSPASAPGTTRTARRAAAPRADRKAQILLAAEKLFAQMGYHAVSIRQIAQEAQVPLALVGYYYGQKSDLFHAIFEHWADTIAERLAGLDTARHIPHSPSKLEKIVEAFVAPVIRLRASAEGEYYALLMTNGLSNQRDEADRVLREFFDPMADAFITALHETLQRDFPDQPMSRGTAAWCYQFALGTLLHHLSDTRVERLSHGQCTANDPSVQHQLVRFIVCGIRGAAQAFQSPTTTTGDIHAT